MNFLKLLTFLILFLFPFGELLRFDVGSNVVIKPLDIAVGVTVVFWIGLSLRAKWANRLPSTTPRKWPFFTWLLITFPLIGLLSLVTNSAWLKPAEILISSLYIIRWVLYALMSFVISQFDDRFKKIIMIVLFFDGLIILLFGYIQYLLFPSLKSLYHLGWDDHMYRMFSVFLDPNFAGAFFVLYLLFIAGEVFSQTKEKNKKKKLILMLTLGLTFMAVLLTYSRSAILMLIVGTATFLILIQKKRLFFIILGIIMLFAVIIYPNFYIENINLFRAHSSKARLDNYSTALKIISDRPLLGIGFNSYRYAKQLHGVKQGWTNAPSHADAGVDNSFLFVMATTGIVGLAAYFFLWLFILKKSYFIFRKNLNLAAILVISSSAALFTNAMFINSLFFPAFMLWMWVLIGLLKK